MKNKKYLMLVLVGTLLVGSMSGCGAAAVLPNGNAAQIGGSLPQTSNEAASVLAAYAGNGGDDKAEGNAYEEQFKAYEQFGMVYDAEKKELYYNGKVVRWFEDYYTIADGTQAGRDFFNEDGVVDIYAVRDLNSFVRSDDGSFDPSGTLVDVKEFSEEEFAARDIAAIKNPPPIVATAGDPVSAKELEDMAKEYEAFGVTYDVEKNQWYFNGEKVRYFQDVLTSNGESLTGGKFHGEIRNSWNESGSIDVYTVRDFSIQKAAGNGTLTGVEKFSQAEFDEHTKRETQSGSGFCTVTQD